MRKAPKGACKRMSGDKLTCQHNYIIQGAIWNGYIWMSDWMDGLVCMDCHETVGVTVRDNAPKGYQAEKRLDRQ